MIIWLKLTRPANMNKGETGESVFADTSAFYALMDRSDAKHEEAATIWTYLSEKEFLLVTTNYVVLETTALLQNRLGFDAANLWYKDVFGLAEIFWINESLQRQAYEIWAAMELRRLSLTDCVSFTVMRNCQIKRVFCFDRHFEDQGFEIICGNFNTGG